VALRGEIVDFVGLHFLDDADQIRRVGQVAVLQEETDVRLVRIMVQMIDAIGVDHNLSTGGVRREARRPDP
jgi:hypothetical protein